MIAMLYLHCYSIAECSNPASFYLFLWDGEKRKPDIHCLRMCQFLNYIINKHACDDTFDEKC